MPDKHSFSGYPYPSPSRMPAILKLKISLSPAHKKLLLLSALLFVVSAIGLIDVFSSRSANEQIGFVAHDTRDRIWMDAGDRLWVLGRDGRTELELLPATSGVPAPYGGMAALEDGGMAVGSLVDHKVYLLNAAGQLQKVLDLSLPGTPEIAYNRATKTLYTSDNLSGKIRAWRGETLITSYFRLQEPMGIAIGANQEIWVAENEGPDVGFAVFSPDLQLLRRVKSGSKPYPCPSMVAVGNGNTVFAVLNDRGFRQGHIAVYENEALQSVQALPGDGDAFSVSADSKGQAVLVDTGSGRLLSYGAGHFKPLGDARLLQHLARYGTESRSILQLMLWLLMMTSSVVMGLHVLIEYRRAQATSIHPARGILAVGDFPWSVASPRIGPGRFLGICAAFGFLIWNIFSERCGSGFTCVPDGDPLRAVIFLSMINLGNQFYHRTFMLLQTIGAKKPLQLCISSSPQLAQRINELGGLYDYEPHFPAPGNLQTMRHHPLIYVLLTPQALLVVHLQLNTCALQDMQEYRFAEGVTLLKAKNRDQWRIQGPQGLLFELQCTGPGGQRLAETMRYLQDKIRPTISGAARWLPGWPGELGGRSTLLVLLVAPTVWLALTGRWFSLGTVLCLVPLLGFVIDHHRVNRAYNRRAFAPVTLDS